MKQPGGEPGLAGFDAAAVQFPANHAEQGGLDFPGAEFRTGRGAGEMLPAGGRNECDDLGRHGFVHERGARLGDHFPSLVPAHGAEAEAVVGTPAAGFGQGLEVSQAILPEREQNFDAGPLEIELGGRRRVGFQPLRHQVGSAPRGQAGQFLQEGGGARGLAISLPTEREHLLKLVEHQHHGERSVLWAPKPGAGLVKILPQGFGFSRRAGVHFGPDQGAGDGRLDLRHQRGLVLRVIQAEINRQELARAQYGG